MNFNITIIGQTISFIIFVIFCMKFIWPPIIHTIEERQKDLKRSLNMKKKIEFDALIVKKTAAQHINNAENIAHTIITKANLKKNSILEKVKLEAIKEKNIIISQAYIEIELQRRKVLRDLQEEISDISLLIAKKIIKNTLKKNIDLNILNKLATH